MNAYLATEVAREAELEPGAFYWHEVMGTPVRDIGGVELGFVNDIYRVGGAEVYVVTGGAFGSFDLPVVSAFVRTLDPKGEGIVIDAGAIGLELNPVEKPRRIGPRVRRALKAAQAAEIGETTEAAEAGEHPVEAEPADEGRA